MSAGFMYGNQAIIRKDLRHIYSGAPPSDVRFRVRTYHSGIDHLSRLHELQTRRRTPREPPRRYEYLQQYDIAIPRAPAFKRLSKPEIHELVQRLNKSKNTDETKLLEQIKDVDDANKHHIDAPGGIKRAVTPKLPPMTSERIDVNALIQRLHYNGSTHISKLRQREIVGHRMKSRPNSSYI